MPTHAPESVAIKVSVCPEKLTAQMLIPADLDRTMVTPQLCQGLLRQAGVEVTDEVEQAVLELFNRPVEPGQEVSGIIARALPPRHGEDGRVEWDVDTANQDGAKTEDNAIDYYAQSAFVMAMPGNVLGRVHPPTPGEDGRDVCGRTIVARAGKDAKLKTDESIMRDASGTLIAQAEGVLKRDNDFACIRKLIEIPNYVDFSTGNIDFNGDITIGQGVRDCFVVKATGNIEVKGLIEAATIDSGGDLIAHGGFAGRERGTANIGRNLIAKYLDNIQGEVLGDLCADREVINCEMTIHGGIIAPHGALIGGRLAVTGAVETATIGSGANVPTELLVGSVPRLEPLAVELTDIIEQYNQDKKAMLEEQNMLNKMATKNRMTATDKERQTEIMFELSSIDNALGKAQPTLDNLNHKINEQRTVKLAVSKKIFGGATFCYRNQRYTLQDEVRGPVRISLDSAKSLICQQGDSKCAPLAEICDVSAVTP